MTVETERYVNMRDAWMFFNQMFTEARAEFKGEDGRPSKPTTWTGYVHGEGRGRAKALRLMNTRKVQSSCQQRDNLLWPVVLDRSDQGDHAV